jgi:hypothetical protein
LVSKLSNRMCIIIYLFIREEKIKIGDQIWGLYNT